MAIRRCMRLFLAESSPSYPTIVPGHPLGSDSDLSGLSQWEVIDLAALAPSSLHGGIHMVVATTCGWRGDQQALGLTRADIHETSGAHKSVQGQRYSRQIRLCAVPLRLRKLGLGGRSYRYQSLAAKRVDRAPLRPGMVIGKSSPCPSSRSPPGIGKLAVGHWHGGGYGSCRYRPIADRKTGIAPSPLAMAMG